MRAALILVFLTSSTSFASTIILDDFSLGEFSLVRTPTMPLSSIGSGVRIGTPLGSRSISARGAPNSSTLAVEDGVLTYYQPEPGTRRLQLTLGNPENFNYLVNASRISEPQLEIDFGYFDVLPNNEPPSVQIVATRVGDSIAAGQSHEWPVVDSEAPFTLSIPFPDLVTRDGVQVVNDGINQIQVHLLEPSRLSGFSIDEIRIVPEPRLLLPFQLLLFSVAVRLLFDPQPKGRRRRRFSMRGFLPRARSSVFNGRGFNRTAPTPCLLRLRPSAHTPGF